ncbi:YciI family protein [Plastoroseomonas arctica]|uniref:YCII-related domain-containing protein n=1 Tax=Plastoroseomonas arctica TaxID=1509237 RepID=A0AAF1KPH2_9PROT|nr:YciI family protein [Plastoroseomonas arctica]MBR0657539.1 hypothetical protein [Plastoroseomonas arctica]
MQVALIFHESAEDLSARSDPARAGAYWGAWKAYVGALTEAGVVRGGNALLGPETGAVLRHRGGADQVLDGPYAETKEQLGGFLAIEVADMPAALAWAARCPCAATGAVEVRPILPMQS